LEISVRYLSVVVVPILVACAPGASIDRPASSQLASRLDQEIASRGAVPWSDRPLSWDDYRGSAPADPGDRGALTAYTILHAAQCTGERFEFRVIAAMLPEASWVAPAVRKDQALSARTLRHEQTHFDLTEVHARRLRRYFAELYSPCTRTTAELDTLAGRFMKEEAEAQRRYDTETRYGRSAEPQRGWDAEVARQLRLLGRFGEARLVRPSAEALR
jgi:hypothetical protein